MPRYAIDAKQFSPRSLRGMISSAKNAMVTPARVWTSGRLAAAGEGRPRLRPLRGGPPPLQRDGPSTTCCSGPSTSSKGHPDVLQKYQERWAYLHIDEYQDTNRAQYTLAKMLAARHKKPLRGRRRRPEHLRLPRRRHHRHPLLPARLPRGHHDPPSSRTTARPKKILQLAGSVIRQKQGPARKGAVGRRTARADYVHPHGGALGEGTRRRRWSGRSATSTCGAATPGAIFAVPLPDERAEPRHRGRAEAGGNPVPRHRGRLVLPAPRDQGRPGLPPPARQPQRHRLAPPRHQLPHARDRGEDAGADRRVRAPGGDHAVAGPSSASRTSASRPERRRPSRASGL